MRSLLAIVTLISLHAHALPVGDSIITARSAGKLTFLAYGLGEDRLGGAKSGYIDTNILLRIIDSTKTQYLVKLSKQHNAYVSKSEVVKDTTSMRPFYLTNSWSVKGDDVYDYVNINLDERLPYKSWMEINPSKIVVDIYGVQSNTNWINQLRTVEEVKDVYFNQLEDDLVRVTIELKHKQQWGYTIAYRSKTLMIRIRRQPASLKIKKLLIAVDAGHGGSNTGATGITSKGLEKNYTIRFANELQKLLEEKGVQVIMTRTDDTTIDNRDRVLMLQEAMPHLLISLHLNSSANTSVQGVSTYYKHIAFRPLSTAILDRMLDLKLNEFGNVGNFNFTLNAPTDFPNALVEIAFLSNADDEKRILDPRFHKAVARKVYLGIKDWLKKVKRPGRA
jgi:N-acetylmuramoyl-L-alanine amidase